MDQTPTPEPKPDLDLHEAVAILTTRKRRLLDPILLLAAVLLVAGSFWIASIVLQGQRQIRATTMSTNQNTRTIQAVLDRLNAVTDPTGCVARRAGYATQVAILQIVNDNRAIQGVKQLPIPKPPADITSCSGASAPPDLARVTSDEIRDRVRVVVVEVPVVRTVTRTVIVCRRPNGKPC